MYDLQKWKADFFFYPSSDSSLVLCITAQTVHLTCTIAAVEGCISLGSFCRFV